MKIIELDAENWKEVSDFYDAMFTALGAPSWHGRVPVALVDSMVLWGGQNINAEKPPYTVRILNVEHASEVVRAEITKTIEIMEHARERNRIDTEVYLELA